MTSIGVAISCVRCDYDLRGSELDGRCPECGTPVTVSHSADEYVVRDPTWVRRLAAGARMGGAVHPTVVAIVVLASFTGLVVMLDTENRKLGEFAMVACLIVLIGGQFLIMRCVWLVTSVPPLHVLKPKDEMARRIVRVSAIIVVAATAQLSWSLVANDGKNWGLLLIRIGSPVGVAGVVGGIAFGLYCRRLAELLRETHLQTGIKVRLAIFVVSSLVSAIGQSIVTGGGNQELGGVLIACGSFAQVISGASLLMMPRQFIHRLEMLRAAGGAYSVTY